MVDHSNIIHTVVTSVLFKVKWNQSECPGEDRKKEKWRMKRTNNDTSYMYSMDKKHKQNI